MKPENVSMPDTLALDLRRWLLLVLADGRALWLTASGEWPAVVGRC